jgi:hypothetical protein
MGKKKKKKEESEEDYDSDETIAKKKVAMGKVSKFFSKAKRRRYLPHH